MTDNKHQQYKQDPNKSNDEGARIGSAAARSAAQAVGETVRHGAEGDRAGGETLRQSSEAGAETLRNQAEAGSETMRQVSEVMTETAHQGRQAVADGQHVLLQSAAEQVERMGQQLAQAVQDTAQDVRHFMVLPTTAGRGMQDLQQSVNSFVEGMIRTNVHATQELSRLVSPGAFVELQQRFAREYLDAFMQGSASLVRATRQAAEETLRPLERQIEQRQQTRQKRGNVRSQGQESGRVADVMNRTVRIANPEDTVQQVARIMREEDTGVLPVGDRDRLVGMVTDRDVTLRLVAEGKNPAHTKVREVMTPAVRYVFEDEKLGDVAENMAEQQLRRMPVVDRDKRLVGIVSLGDFARNGQTARLGQAFGGTVRTGEQHSRTAAE